MFSISPSSRIDIGLDLARILDPCDVTNHDRNAGPYGHRHVVEQIGRNLPERGDAKDDGGERRDGAPDRLLRLRLAQKLPLEDRNVVRRQLADPSLTDVRRGLAASRDLAGK